MRTFRTFVLRLLIDGNQPDLLHGSLQEVGDAVPTTFSGEPALLALLYCREASPELACDDEPHPATNGSQTGPDGG